MTAGSAMKARMLIFDLQFGQVKVSTSLDAVNEAGGQKSLVEARNIGLSEAGDGNAKLDSTMPPLCPSHRTEPSGSRLCSLRFHGIQSPGPLLLSMPP